MKTEFSRQVFQKYRVIRCNENPPRGSRVVQSERDRETDRQTDRRAEGHDEANSLLFAIS